MTIAENPIAAGVDIFSPARPPARAGLVDVERFHSPEVLAEEMTKLWGKVWQVACLLSEVPNEGDYHEYVVVPSGAHRAGGRRREGLPQRLSPPRPQDQDRSGSNDRLTCISHGWTWKLDGDIDHIPERDSFCPFADSEVKLAEVAFGVFKDFVFINPDVDAPQLEKHLAGMADIIEPYRYDRMYRWRSMTTTMLGNWKNVVDAFTENYHARTVHPESTAFVSCTDPAVVLVDDTG